jgi:hypothetical protein
MIGAGGRVAQTISGAGVLRTPGPWRSAQCDQAEREGKGTRVGGLGKAATRRAVTRAGRLTKGATPPMADSHATPANGCTPDTLAERVCSLIMPDLGPGDWVANHPALPEGTHLSGDELDIRDWGMIYGLAFGIARGEDAYEAVSSVGDRALRAAEAAFRRWGNDSKFLDGRKALPDG